MSGSGFDPRASEFGGANIGPATLGTLEAIATSLESLTAQAPEYATIEHAILHKGNPIVFKKYLEPSLNVLGREFANPFGEMTVYDRFCDTPAMQYIIYPYPKGSVLRMPHTLNGYSWEIDDLWSVGEDGVIEGVVPSSPQILPRPLTELQVDDLSFAMFDLLGVNEDDRVPGAEGVLRALDLAASRGVRTVQREQRHWVKGRILIPEVPADDPDQTFNDELHVETFSREHIPPGLRSAVKSSVFIREYVGPYVLRETTFTVYENDTGRYEYDESDDRDVIEFIKNAIDKGKAGPWFTNEEGELTEEEPEPRNFDFTYDQDFARLEREAKLAGLHVATQEQAQEVASTLERMLPRVKWHLAL